MLRKLKHVLQKQVEKTQKSPKADCLNLLRFLNFWFFTVYVCIICKWDRFTVNISAFTLYLIKSGSKTSDTKLVKS